MSWYNGGDYSGLRVATAGRNVLSELLYAINEREYYTGIDVTSWAMPVTTDWPGVSDLSGDRKRSYGAIITQAQGAIETLLTEPDADKQFQRYLATEAYAISTLFEDAGYSAWLTPGRVCDHAPLTQLRAMLDLLIWINLNGALQNVTSVNGYGGDGSTEGAGQETSWDSAAAQTINHTEKYLRRWQLHQDEHPVYAWMTMLHKETEIGVTWNTGLSLSASKFVFHLRDTHDTTFYDWWGNLYTNEVAQGALEYSFDGESLTAESELGAETALVIERDDSIVIEPMPGYPKGKVLMSWTPEATCPLPALAIDEGTSRTVIVDGCDVYGSILGSLTYG